MGEEIILDTAQKSSVPVLWLIPVYDIVVAPEYFINNE